MRKEINCIKAFAAVAVIFLHFNAFQFTPQTLYWDQLLRFCVPLFVALSGYTLAKKYLATNLSLKDFYFRRTVKLLPSYIFWSLIIFFTLNFSFISNFEFRISNLVKILVWGNADYHLYFVPMIFQLYLLFPFLFLLSRKFSLPVLLFSLVAQIISYNFYNQNIQYNDQSQYIHFVSWIYFFSLGIFLAKNDDYFIKKSKTSLIISLLLIISGFIWSILEANSQIAKNIDLLSVTKTTRYPIIIYATGIISLFILFSNKLLLLPNKLINFLNFLGEESFVIYLAHTLFLRLVFTYTKPSIYQGDTLIIFCGLIIGLTLTYLPRVFKKFFTL